jgi:hypothetical protein
VIGWSVHSAATLPVYFVVWIFAFHGGRDRRRLSSVRRFLLVASAPSRRSRGGQTIPVWAFAAAALVALLPAATILPKSSDDAVWLAAAPARAEIDAQFLRV